jgi:branched-chain amino acid transport system substrate-binding protein
MATLGMVMLVATTAVACSSTNSSSTTTTSGSAGGAAGSSIPASAFSDHTGITATSVSVANVATLSLGGLFKGATVGAQAYAAYVNSTGGVNGRRIHVNGADDTFTGSGNKQATQNAITNDFALVGGFSLEDSFGGTLLKQNPGMPNVSVVLDQATNKLPNVFSAVPLNGGWEQGPLQYLKAKFPQDVARAGAMVANLPSAEVDWTGEKSVMQKVGFKVIYDQTYGVTQTDFTQNVIEMKNAGVKILFIDQAAESYASALLKALVQQDFHPVVVLGAATYTPSLVADSGGPAAVNGAYLDQNVSLYLGQDSSAIPAVATFLHWVNVASPGFKPDLFTVYGWLSAELFSQALKNAGSNPSRGSLLQALSKVTTFDGNHLVAPNNPAAKTIGNCYLIGHVVNGDFQRLDDPPASSGTHGYRCDFQYVNPAGA